MADRVVTSQRRQRAARRSEDARGREADAQRRAEARQAEVDRLLAIAAPARERPERRAATVSPPISAAPRATPRPVPQGPAVSVARPVPKRLPWEGADVDDRYNRGIAAMMREVPGGRR